MDFYPLLKTWVEVLVINMAKKLFDSAKKSTADAIKTASKGAILNTAEATGDLIGNKIAEKITSVSKKSSDNNSNNDDDDNNDDVELTTHKKKIYISRRKVANY